MEQLVNVILGGLAVFLATFVGTLIVFFRTQSGVINRVASGVTTSLQEPIQRAAEKADEMTLSAREFANAVRELSAPFQTMGSYLVAANGRLAETNLKLEGRLDELESRAKEQNTKLELYAKTVDELLRGAEVQSRANQDLGQKVRVMEDTLSGTKSDLDQTKLELDQTKRDLEATRVELAEAKLHIQELEVQRNTAQAEKLRLERELDAERLRFADLQKKFDEQQQRIVGLEQRVKELEAQAPSTAEVSPDIKDGEVKPAEGTSA